MSSDIDNSPGTSGISRAGYPAPETAGNPDGWAELIAQSDAAVAHLLASTDWVAHADLLARLAEQSAQAAALLVDLQTAFTVGTVPVVQSESGETPT